MLASRYDNILSLIHPCFGHNSYIETVWPDHDNCPVVLQPTSLSIHQTIQNQESEEQFYEKQIQDQMKLREEISFVSHPDHLDH
jgi:hypothetical protein